MNSKTKMVATNTSLLRLAAGAAVSVGLMAGSARAQYVWGGITSGNFSNGANWVGGIAPPLSNAATTLTFNQGNTAAITATNDLGSPFVANALTFNVANSFTVNSTLAANLIQLVGPSPSITLSGLGLGTLSATGANLQLAGNTTIGGSGLGGLTISGAITETGGARSLTISGAAPLPAWRMVTLGSGSNTFSGGLTLDGGTVQTAGFGANTFGAAGSTLTVTSNGGVIASSANLSNGVGLGTIQLNGTLRFIGSGVSLPLATASTAALLNGSGSLVLNHSGSTGVTLSGNSTGYTGAVTIDRSTLPNFTGNAGGFILSGVGGSSTLTGALVNVPSFDIRSGGTLTLSNTTANTLQNGNRIGDSAAINLRSGNLTLNGPAAAGAAGFNPTNLTETIGVISGAGYSAVTATTGTGSGITTTLNAASLSRVDRGTFLFRGTGLGDGTVATRGNITFYTTTPGLVGGGGAPGSNAMSILPYAIGDTSGTGTGTSLVTYDAQGLRPLATTEYAADVVSGTTTNARLTTAIPNGGATAVNAVVLATGGSITGSGTLSIGSGTILNTNASGSISNTVDFGAVEGQVFTPAALSISGPLQGTNGLTKSGGGALTLTAVNTGLSGPLTINAGAINFNSASALPGTGQIVVNGTSGGSSGAGLTYSGGTSLAVSRDIAVGAGLFNPVSTTAGSTLTLSGQISGAGGLFVSTTGDIALTGLNTYTGPTCLAGGNLHISSDANLGNGGGLNLSTSATAGLILDGDWTTNRPVNVSGATMINTQSFNATLNGPLSAFAANALTQASAAAITKLGSGVLNLASNNDTFTGPINVNAGTLLVNGTLAASTTNAVSVAASAILGGSGSIMRNVNIAAGGSLAPGNSAGILAVSGNVTLSAGAFLNMELNGPLPGNGPGFSDQLVVNGGVTITDAILSAALGYTPVDGSRAWLVVNDGTDAVTGTFSGLPEGATVGLGIIGGFPYSAQISYAGDFASGQVSGLGNDIVLYNIVPSPGTASLLVLGGIFAARRRRGG